MHVYNNVLPLYTGIAIMIINLNYDCTNYVAIS